MPSTRNNRDGWWATAFDDFEAAVRFWAVLNAAVGYSPDESINSAWTWALNNGYLPEGYQRMGVDTGKIAETKARYRIEDVAAGLTPLRANGKALRGRCPIHKGDNPTAFVVWPEIQRAKCYNCSWSGDVIDLMNIAGIRR